MTYLVYIYIYFFLSFVNFLLCVGFQCLFIILFFFHKIGKRNSQVEEPMLWRHVLFSYLHLFHCRKTFLVDENVDIINNPFGKEIERERERENLPLSFHVHPPNRSAGGKSCSS